MAKKGSALVCVPCGREILVTESGTAYRQLWCCGVGMEPSAKPKAKAKKKAPARKKAVKKKAAKKKAPAKKTVKKKAPAKKKAARKKK